LEEIRKLSATEPSQMVLVVRLRPAASLPAVPFCHRLTHN
jgi:hypothetical protein